MISLRIRTIEETVRRAPSEIELIRPYRMHLIAEAVAGKLDVRDLAPTPGDEMIEAEDLDEGIDDEEMLGDDKPELVEEAAHAED